MIRFRPAIVALAWILPGSGSAALPLKDTAVFQGSLDGHSDLVFMALHPEMTVAFDGKTGALYLAWKGRALRTSETAPGAEILFHAAGSVYHRQNQSRVWTVRDRRGRVETVAAAFQGVVRTPGHDALKTMVPLSGGRKIMVMESPEFDNHYGDNALRRNFFITGIPPGVTVTLALSGEGMPEIWGGGGAGRLEKSPQGKWQLIQSQDGETPLKVTWSEPKVESVKSPF